MKLKDILKEAGLKRFKVYVSGEKKPLILMGKNAKEVKQLAYQMIRNSSVKIKKVVREGGPGSGPQGNGEDNPFDREPSDDELKDIEKQFESWDSPQSYSSREAKNVIDGALKNYAKDLRKVQYRVVKDWMNKAKAGTIDYFDLIRGLTTGDIKRAHPYETEFLHKVLTKDKIINRFRKYFGGKKGKAKRRKNQRGM